jgi:hypothetical protein
MPEHQTGTCEEWQVARDELAKLEAEQGARNEEIKQASRAALGPRWTRSTCSDLSTSPGSRPVEVGDLIQHEHLRALQLASLPDTQPSP